MKPAEIVSFWSACDKLGGPFGPLYKILLLTGCRLREVSDMRRTELSADYCTIPGSRTKNHRPHALPVPTMARQIINSVPVIEGEGYVFTTTGKTPVSGFSKSKQLLDEVMVEYAGGPVEPWRTHDLRRTAASGMQKLGIRTEVIERALNHVSGSFAGVAGIYQCDPLEPEVREALQRWADHIAGLVEGRPDNVVPLPRKAQ